MKTAVFFLLIVLTAAVPLHVSGRVFSRRPAGGSVPAALLQIGGYRAYTAPVLINGAPAVLTVTGFDDPRHQRMAEIRALFQLGAASRGDSLHVIERDGVATRLLLLRPGGGNHTLAVAIEQTAADFRKTRAAVPAPNTPLPLYPGAVPGLQAENEDTGLHFMTTSVAADPAQITAFYQASLAAAGWLPAFPNAGLHRGLFYVRKNAFCMVLIAAGSESAARVTLLHKPFRDVSP